MKFEVNLKRQAVGSCNSLLPYAGDHTSHTADILRLPHYIRFLILSQGESLETLL